MFNIHIKRSILTTPLSKEEETELFRKYREEGNIKARDRIILSYLGFLIKESLRYYKNMDVCDCVQECALLLMKLIDTFNTSYDNKFGSYACGAIRGNLAKFVYEESKAIRIKGTCRTKEGMVQIHSLDVPLNFRDNIGRDKRSDLITSEDDPVDVIVLNKLTGERIIKSLDILTDREKKIIKMYYGLYDKDDPMYAKNISLKEIGKQMGFTRERIRQVKNMALKKLLRVNSYDPSKWYIRRRTREQRFAEIIEKIS